MSDLLEEARRVYREADLLASRHQVEAALDRMAEAITRARGEKNPLVVPVMTGGLVPGGLLLPRLDFPLTLDYIHATRYREKTSGGELDWKVEPHQSLEGRAVLLIDDILDEGLTLEAIVAYCKAAGASEVRTAVLVEKLRPRPVEITADFVGLRMEDRYLFGYGMDYKGHLRNAPGIYAVKGM